MEHNEWITKTTGGDSARSIAKKSGVPNRTVLNQQEKGTYSAENVIKIAEGYNKSPVRALVDTGYLDEEWAKSVDPETAIWQLTEEQIDEHVLDRMKLPGAHEVFETPVDELADRRAALSESNEQGHPRPDDEDDGTVREWSDHDHAADSSPDEDQAREDARIDPHD